MSVASLKSTVLPGLLSGLRGGPVPVIAGITSDIQALALTAQALRFDRPPRPESFNIEDSVTEARRVVPEAVREPLVRLVTERRETASRDVLLRAVASAMSAKRVRLHPFDLATLGPFVEAYSPELGAEATAYAQRNVKAERKVGYFSPEEMSDETWMLGNRGEKAKYIARRRAEEPAAARLLVEESWPSQDVDSRVRIAGALRVGVSNEDKPFLTSLLKDRSPRVRDVARGALARLPEYEGDDGHLKGIMNRIRIKEHGMLLMRRKEMRLDLPGSVSHYGSLGWVEENFAKVGIEEFSGAYGMTVADIVAAASRDGNMLHAVLVMAICSGAADIVADLTVNVLKDDGEGFFSVDPALYEHLTEGERSALLKAAVQPESWSKFPTMSIVKANALIEGPMDEVTMRSILSSRAWRSAIQSGGRMSSDAVESLAVMCPRALRDQLGTQLRVMDPQYASRANLFLEIIEHLETSHD